MEPFGPENGVTVQEAAHTILVYPKKKNKTRKVRECKKFFFIWILKLINDKAGKLVCFPLLDI
ncbi:MAG: hypothetical protein D3924_18210 [Candidatus Electrothrix sp. AR4]|nr:hypothetical protein [Candidatus Electrothrix sp. AR4]